MRVGYFGVGIYRPKVRENIGTLWRSAAIYEAKFVFTIDRRVQRHSGDTVKVEHLLPMYHYEDFNEFLANIPNGAHIIGVEQSEQSESLATFSHPERAIYLMGAEDGGLPGEVQDCCDSIVEIPTPLPICHNVSTAATLVLHDRFSKRGRKRAS